MYTNLATRASIVALKATGKTTAEVAEITNITPRTINRIYARAIERGFDPAHRPLLLEDSHLADAPRSGRPSVQNEIKDEVIAIVTRDRCGREKTSADIAGELSQQGIEASASTVWRTLRKAGY